MPDTACNVSSNGSVVINLLQYIYISMYEIGKALETYQRHPIRYEDILSQSRPRLHTYNQPTNQPANQSTNSQTQHNSHLPFPHCKNHPSPSTFLIQISVPWHLSIYSYQSVGRAKTAEVLSGFPTYMHSELLTYLTYLYSHPHQGNGAPTPILVI